MRVDIWMEWKITTTKLLLSLDILLLLSVCGRFHYRGSCSRPSTVLIEKYINEKAWNCTLSKFDLPRKPVLYYSSALLQYRSSTFLIWPEQRYNALHIFNFSLQRTQYCWVPNANIAIIGQRFNFNYTHFLLLILSCACVLFEDNRNS